MPAGTETLAGLLAYDRTAVAAGQAWRLVTGLASHWSVAHAVVDASAIGLLSFAIRRREGARILFALLGLAIVTQAATLAWCSDAAQYRGSSGIAWALGAYALVRSLDGRPPWQAAVAPLLSAFAWATALGRDSPVLPAGVLPDPAMHLAGALAGSALALAQSLRARVSISSLLRFT